MNGRGKHNSIARRLVGAAMNAVNFGGALASLSYRCGLHGRLEVSQHSISLAVDQRLDAPLVLAFASDLHAGATTDPRLLAELFEQLAQIRPDVLLLGGDFISHNARDVDALTRHLSACNPRCGKYAVLGNHDLWADAAEVTRCLSGSGVDVLVNRNIALPAPFESVSICGIDDPWTGEADVARAFDGANPVRVFLAHSPDGILLLDGRRYAVGFAGHTHGGQVALPDGTPIIDAGGPLARSHSRGLFPVPGNGPLIVSRGVGCSSLPIRINADPELVLCTVQ